MTDVHLYRRGDVYTACCLRITYDLKLTIDYRRANCPGCVDSTFYQDVQAQSMEEALSVGVPGVDLGTELKPKAHRFWPGAQDFSVYTEELAAKLRIT